MHGRLHFENESLLTAGRRRKDWAFVTFFLWIVDGSASLATVVNTTAAFSCCAIQWKPQTVQSLCGRSLHICAGLCFQISSFSNGVINTLTAFLQGFCSTALLIWVLEAAALFSWVKMKWGKAAERSIRASTRCFLKSSDIFPSACPLSSMGSPPGMTYLDAPVGWPSFTPDLKQRTSTSCRDLLMKIAK